MPVMLVVLLAVLSPLTFLCSYKVYQVETTRKDIFVAGTELISGLPVNRLAKIEIKRKNGSISLKKEGESFLIESHGDYPAKNAEVNDFIRKCTRIEKAEKITESALHHSQFSLSATDLSDDSVVVTFFDEAAKPLSGFLVGEKHKKRQGNYVREMNKDTVFVSEEEITIPRESLDFAEKSLLNLGRSDIAWIDNREFRIHTEGEGFALDDVPQGFKVKGNEHAGLADALSYFSFEDAIHHKQEKVGKLVFDRHCEIQLKAPIRYHLEFATSGEDHFVRISASWTGSQTIDLKKDAPKEELEKIEADFMRNESLKKENQIWSQWVYRIAKNKADLLTKKKADVIEAVKTEPAIKPEEPVKPTISHVLISYEGAERSSVTGQTKEEAKARAEEVLAKVTANPADFAAIAREYSDCPSKEKDGSLGVVEKGAMVPPFEAAAYALSPGQISEVIETPFGYHVIRRDQ